MSDNQELMAKIEKELHEVNMLTGECNYMLRQILALRKSVDDSLEDLKTELGYMKGILPEEREVQAKEPAREPEEVEFVTNLSASLWTEEKLQKYLEKRKLGLQKKKQLLNVYFLCMESVKWYLDYEVLPEFKLIWSYYESLDRENEIKQQESWEEIPAASWPWAESSNRVMENKHMMFVQRARDYYNTSRKVLNWDVLRKPVETLSFDERRILVDRLNEIGDAAHKLRIYLTHCEKQREGRQLREEVQIFKPEKLMQYW